MAQNKIEDWQTGDAFSASHLNQTARVARQWVTTLASGKIHLRQTPSGTTINLPNSNETFPVRFGVITHTGPGGGADYTDARYYVKPIFLEGTDPTALPVFHIASPITTSAGVPMEDYPFTAVYLNDLIATTRTLRTDETQPVMLVAVYNTHGKCVWMLVPLDSREIKVDLTQSGGGDGSNTTKATWTYTAKYAGTTDVFMGGAVLTVRAQRPLGKMTKATQGEVWWDAADSVWKIWSCDEVPNLRLVQPDAEIACDGDGNVTGTAVDVLTPT